MDKLQAEIDRNFDSFQRVVQSYLPDHRGEWALMRSGKVIDLHQDAMTAEADGIRRYPDQLFSIQQITDGVVDLGFFSHVVH